MKNTNEILERILLNMKYDSKKTLCENKESLIKKKLIYDIVTETTTDPPRKKVPKITVGPLTRIWTLRDQKLQFPEELKNAKITTTKDYNGKTIKFYGNVNKTVGEYLQKYLDILNQNKYAYRGTQETRLVPKGDYYDLPGANNPKWKAHPGYNKTDKSQIPMKGYWKRVRRGFSYTDDFLGKMAKRCKDFYQSNWWKNYGYGKKNENMNFKYTTDYLEPPEVSECTKQSIKKLIDKAGKDTPWIIYAFNPMEASFGREGWGYYYLQWGCKKYYHENYKGQYEGPCSRGLTLYGYKSNYTGKWLDWSIISNIDKPSYTINDICKWINNPKSTYYGWDYEKLVQNGKILKSDKNEKIINGCNPKRKIEDKGSEDSAIEDPKYTDDIETKQLPKTLPKIKSKTDKKEKGTGVGVTLQLSGG